jgi:hypothetical protein
MTFSQSAIYYLHGLNAGAFDDCRTFIFYKTARRYKNRRKQSLLYNAEQASGRFDDVIAKMENGIEFLLSDIDALDSHYHVGQ